MPFRLRKKESIAGAVRRLSREELDKAMAELRAVAQGRPQGLHEARKCIKKLRALVRLVRDRLDASGKQVIDALRDAARPLSGARDAQAMVQCLDALVAAKLEPAKLSPEQVTAVAKVRAELVARSEAATAHDGQWSALVTEPLDVLEQVRVTTQTWKIRPNTFAALSRGLRKSYRNARDAMHLALLVLEPAGEAGDERQSAVDEPLHEWRKHVKIHWYHIRLLRPIWPRMMMVLASELGKLSELLGDDHDLSVLEAGLSSASPAGRGNGGTVQNTDADAAADVDVLIKAIHDRRAELRAQAAVLGRRLLADKPGAMLRRLRQWWSAWHA